MGHIAYLSNNILILCNKESLNIGIFMSALWFKKEIQRFQCYFKMEQLKE